jgi:AraC family transcriptional regulator
MVQPPLDQHYIVMHQGGAKRVTRRRDGAPLSTIAEDGSLTLVPAGTAFTWQTSGPIAFAHLYIRPEQLSAIHSAEGSFGAASLIDRVGCCDPQLQLLYKRLLESIESFGSKASLLLLDSLLECFLVRLAQRHVSRPLAMRSDSAVALAPHRLRRVVDFIEANLSNDVSLADLGNAAGSSQFHFCRAFHIAAGCSPYQFLLSRRIEYAKALLLTTCDSLEAVGLRCGFHSQRQFAVAFKRSIGVGPKRYQLLRRARAIPHGSHSLDQPFLEAL